MTDWLSEFNKGREHYSTGAMDEAEAAFQNAASVARSSCGEFHISVATCKFAEITVQFINKEPDRVCELVKECNGILDGIINDPRDLVIRFAAELAFIVANTPNEVSGYEKLCRRIKKLDSLPLEYTYPFGSALLSAVYQSNNPAPYQSLIDENVKSISDAANQGLPLAGVISGLLSLQESDIASAQQSFETVINTLEHGEEIASDVFVAAANGLYECLKDQENKDTAEMYLSWGLELMDSVYKPQQSVSTDTMLYSALYYLRNNNVSTAQDLLAKVLLNLDPVTYPYEAIICNEALIEIFAQQENEEAVQDYSRRIAMIYEDSFGHPLPVDQSDKGEDAKPETQKLFIQFRSEIENVKKEFTGRLHPQLRYFFTNLGFLSTLDVLNYTCSLFAENVAAKSNASSSSKETNTLEDQNLFEKVSQLMLEGKTDEALVAVKSELEQQEAELGTSHPSNRPLLEGLLMIYQAIGSVSEAQNIEEKLASL